MRNFLTPPHEAQVWNPSRRTESTFKLGEKPTYKGDPTDTGSPFGDGCQMIEPILAAPVLVLDSRYSYYILLQGLQEFDEHCLIWFLALGGDENDLPERLELGQHEFRLFINWTTKLMG